MNDLLEHSNITHRQKAHSFIDAKEALIRKATVRGDLPYAEVSEQLKLIEELSSFELGRFLIECGGLSGRWIQYIIDTESSSHPLETYLLTKAPICLATKARFAIFKKVIQEHIKEGCSFASVPCGVMAEFLDLNYSQLKNFTLTGIDIDPESFNLAFERGERKGVANHCRFIQRDAWSLGTEERFDLISSNGLTIYEKDDKKVVQLYRTFHKALNPGGVLVTSFIAPLVPLQEETLHPNLLRQKLIFADILDVKWQALRTEENVLKQLREAGFCKYEFLYDPERLFPTVIAAK